MLACAVVSSCSDFLNDARVMCSQTNFAAIYYNVNSIRHQSIFQYCTAWIFSKPLHTYFFEVHSVIMSFVVVYLIRAREFVVVPDNWVQELNSAKLKNYGTNSNQNFLVFWAAANGTSNLLAKPNFNAPIALKFHASTDGVCYICRIKKFFGKNNLNKSVFKILIVGLLI